MVLMLCDIPLVTFLLVTLWFREKMTLQTVYVFFCFRHSSLLFNSLLNPIIYSVRRRQFRVAFIELTCRTVNISEAEEIEIRVFGAPNTVMVLGKGQEHGGLDQQNVEQGNANISGNRTTDAVNTAVN